MVEPGFHRWVLVAAMQCLPTDSAWAGHSFLDSGQLEAVSHRYLAASWARHLGWLHPAVHIHSLVARVTAVRGLRRLQLDPT